MTDKVQKIREELARLKEETSIGLSEHENGVEQGRMEIINATSLFLDSLQEEPKPKFRKGNKVTYLNEEYVVEDITDHYILRSTRERTSVPVVHVGFGNEDYELRLVEEPVSEKWIEELRTKLDSLSKEDFKKVFYKYAVDFNEEPVSDDLHTAAKEYANSITEKTGYRLQLRRAFVYGAKWQKEKMMSKAIDGDITFDYYGDDDKTYGCIAHNSFCLEDFELKDRDKVKVIIIKED